MWEWFSSSFAADPPGWIGLIAAGIGVVVSAVFWRRTWAVVRFLGRAIEGSARAISRIRVTTVDNVKPKRSEFFPPVRWFIAPARSKTPGEYVLFNAGEGSVARNVKLDSLSEDAQIVSAAAWSEIPGQQGAPFMLRTRDLAFWLGVTFRVQWTDARGDRQSHMWTERSN